MVDLSLLQAWAVSDPTSCWQHGSRLRNFGGLCSASEGVHLRALFRTGLSYPTEASGAPADL